MYHLKAHGKKIWKRPRNFDLSQPVPIASKNCSSSQNDLNPKPKNIPKWLLFKYNCAYTVRKPIESRFETWTSVLTPKMWTMLCFSLKESQITKLHCRPKAYIFLLKKLRKRKNHWTLFIHSYSLINIK